MTKIAVVTGAAGGMGQAICRRLLDDGCSVIGLDISWPDGTVLEATGFRGVTGDLSDAGAVKTIFDKKETFHTTSMQPQKTTSPSLSR